MANIKIDGFKEKTNMDYPIRRRNILLDVRYGLLIFKPIKSFYKQFKKTLRYE